MQSLLAFLSKYNHWLLFVFLEVVSMVLLFRFNSYQGSVYFTAANAVSGQVLEWNSGVEKFLYQSELNEQLTKRNVQLELQNRQLMAMLNKREAPIPKDVVGYKVISAKVVSNSLGKRDNFIVIDKGSADGVRRDMGVTSQTRVLRIPAVERWRQQDSRRQRRSATRTLQTLRQGGDKRLFVDIPSGTDGRKGAARI